MIFISADWPYAVFDEVEYAEMSARNFNQVNTRFEAETNWIGVVGEDVFEMWLKHHRVSYHRWTHDNWNEKKDFTVNVKPPVSIDVKMLSTKYFPRLSYMCMVTEDQLLDAEVDAYVFGRYVLVENRAILIGWLSRMEFMQLAVKRQEGYVCPENGFTSRRDMREAPLGILRPLRSLIRDTGTRTGMKPD